jgi:hypothetical protein
MKRDERPWENSTAYHEVRLGRSGISRGFRGFLQSFGVGTTRRLRRIACPSRTTLGTATGIAPALGRGSQLGCRSGEIPDALDAREG